MNKTVLLLAPTPPPYGGIASWTIRMLNTHLENGWTVDIVDEKLIGNRGVFSSKKKRFLSELRRITKIWGSLFRKLKNKNILVVHASIPASNGSMFREIISAIITRFRKRPFIIHYRCTLPNMVVSKFNFFLFKRLNKLSTSAIVLNEVSKDFMIRHSKTKVSLIPNFTEVDVPGQAKPINNDVNVISYVGGVTKEKGCESIIQTAPFFPNITFILVGEISHDISKKQIPKNVQLTGPLPKIQVQNIFQKTDIFLFPGNFVGEGFSNSLVEAMAFGIPCIVSNWAANADMIENKGGFVISPNNVGEIVEAINKLTDYNLRTEISKWNINKVKNNYSEKIITTLYVQKYEEVRL